MHSYKSELSATLSMPLITVDTRSLWRQLSLNQNNYLYLVIISPVVIK